MPAPTVPYEEYTPGRRVMGDRYSALRAIVPYLVDNDDAFTFINDVMGYSSASTIGGPITYTDPWRWPLSVNLIAEAFELNPIGVKLSPTPSSFYDKAIVQIEFAKPEYPVSLADDPSNLNQLDPSNPLTYCRQSIRTSARFADAAAGAYEFQDGTPINERLAKLEGQADLVLEFPRIPYLPAARVLEYVGSVNDAAILGCLRGRLLFQGADTSVAAGSDGSYQQSVVLNFTYLSREWNEFQKADGSYMLVKEKGSSDRLFPYKNFTALLL